MKYTVEQIAKITGLTVNTLRVYTSQKGLGTRSGNRVYYTDADVAKLKKGRRSPAAKGKAWKKPAQKRSAPAPVKAKPRKRAGEEKPVKEQPAPIVNKEEPAKKRSFWSFLGISMKPK